MTATTTRQFRHRATVNMLRMGHCALGGHTRTSVKAISSASKS